MGSAWQLGEMGGGQCAGGLRRYSYGTVRFGDNGTVPYIIRDGAVYFIVSVNDPTQKKQWL